MSGPVKVFWIPPQVEPYEPVTPETIEKMAFKIVQINISDQANRALSLIQKSNRVADTKRIRVKISNGDKSYTFDSNGIGISSAGESVGIDTQKLKQVLCE